MNIHEVIEQALTKPTLLEALVFASTCDTEQAIKTAMRTLNSKEVVNITTGAKWETFSTYMFKQILSKWDWSK